MMGYGGKLADRGNERKSGHNWVWWLLTGTRRRGFFLKKAKSLLQGGPRKSIIPVFPLWGYEGNVKDACPTLLKSFQVHLWQTPPPHSVAMCRWEHVQPSCSPLIVIFQSSQIKYCSLRRVVSKGQRPPHPPSLAYCGHHCMIHDWAFRFTSPVSFL